MERRQFLKNALSVLVPGVGVTWLSLRPGSPRAARAAWVRPPGALLEAEFLARCIRCQRCADACPNRAIVALGVSAGGGMEGTPAIQPRRQACMLCNRVKGQYLRCTEACPSGALQPVRKDPEEIQQKVAMGKAVLDKGLCYSYNSWTCGACYRACPFPGRAMTLGLWERPEVKAEGCVGCGACERACIRYPQAIRVRPRAA
ncbi:4Fe-4S dicluster domain-containing protein [Deferrisoma camini]|uniref:4Fe-4S dicluster domain-containing protein n=1 Tax=Deferrisoma camini TaxID=1035120 RepID=UPI00046CAE3C|nr:4Fe-4S dicluster domain-containing protein [Deferrisoma camini]